jgi:hypothetical protein
LHARYADLRLLVNVQHRQVVRQHVLHHEVVELSFLFGGRVAAFVKQASTPRLDRLQY